MPLDPRLSIEPVVRLITLLLMAVVVVMLGRLTWMIVEPSSVLPAADASRFDPVAGGSEGVRVRDYEDVAALSVFGSAAATANRVVNAPDTSLSWVLKGVLADPDPERSGAILAPQGQPEKYYRVGAELPGSVRLEQVLADRVILARDGKLETLRLQRRPLSSGAPAPSRRTANLPQVDTSMTLASDGGVARIDRETWMNDPQRFLQVVSASPVMIDGAMYGLEVSPARNAREFEAAGLQAGDVVTSVEGTPVSEINDYRDILQELTGDRVSLTLERNGEPMTITITMD
ncbi:type II secretion system protein GspC [Halopseudomonas pelagia]|uniref:type II secretion system protein GspC n=1 Tax=Halopseudomonas pelagia TaxID=553151 RepID=UPI0003B78357|nr:type II secretion system protein GspC [Halopseudomonas pelagia]